MPRWPRSGDSRWAWTVRIEWRSRILIWSSTTETITGLDGELAGSVDVPPVTDRLDLRGRPSRTSPSVVLWWPTSAASVAASVAAGVPLSGVPAELALVPMSSGAWADRYVVIAGAAREVEYGADDDPVIIQIARSEDTDRSLYPPPTMVVDDYTWPTSTLLPERPPQIPHWPQGTWAPAESARGATYPIPYGTPGVLGADEFPAVRALAVDTEAGSGEMPAVNRLLVAGGTVESATVTVWFEVGDSSYISDELPVEYGRDGMGQAYAYVDVGSSVYPDIAGVTHFRRTAKSYWSSWPGGGVASTAGGRTPRTASAVAAWILRRSTLSVGAMPAELGGYRLSGYLDESVSPVEWIADRLVGVLPVGLATDADGRTQLTPIRYGAELADAVARVVEGAGEVSRRLPVRIGDGGADLAAVEYAMHGAQDRYMRTAYAADDLVVRSSPVSSAVMPDVWDHQTAARVAVWHRWRDSRAHMEVTLHLASDAYGWLRPGDVVEYVDAGLSITSQVALVVSVEWTDRAIRRVVILW